MWGRYQIKWLESGNHDQTVIGPGDTSPFWWPELVPNQFRRGMQRMLLDELILNDLAEWFIRAGCRVYANQARQTTDVPHKTYSVNVEPAQPTGARLIAMARPAKPH